MISLEEEKAKQLIDKMYEKYEKETRNILENGIQMPKPQKTVRELEEAGELKKPLELDAFSMVRER